MKKMNGREKIEAAFSPQGTDEIPAVICYEEIYVRDHWSQVTACPWWYRASPDLAHQMAWRRHFMEGVGQDWFELPQCAPEFERQNQEILLEGDSAFCVNRLTGERRKISRSVVGGWSSRSGLDSIHPEFIAQTPDEVEQLIPSPSSFDAGQYIQEGRAKLASLLLQEYGRDLYPIFGVSAPLWGCYYIWGFENLMLFIASDPALVHYACKRQLEWSLDGIRQAAALGAKGLWIEECMVDMISRSAYQALSLPFIQAMVDETRSLGLHSIYYFCGSPKGKLDLLLASGADALSLEESKKGFTIDIAEVAEFINGRCALLGNLDAIHLLPNASAAELRVEIARQIAAGWRNRGRFVMSIGSPVTPGTLPQRVRLYTDLAHELGTKK
jgi:uroporphyrinogen-III decarboxylase